MADIGGFLNSCQFLGYVIVDWFISANAVTFMIANLFFNLQQTNLNKYLVLIKSRLFRFNLEFT